METSMMAMVAEFNRLHKQMDARRRSSAGEGRAAAIGLCLLLRRSMRSVTMQTEANAYITEGSVRFAVRTDQFTHIIQSRTKIEKNHSSGGTTVDDRGFSGKSGKF